MNGLDPKIKKAWIQTIKERLKALNNLTRNCPLCKHLKADCSKCPIDADNDEPLLTFSCDEYFLMVEEIERQLLEQLKKLEGKVAT